MQLAGEPGHTEQRLADIQEQEQDAGGLSGEQQQRLSRQQKRVLRQKRAKQRKQAEAQESNLSEAAEDYALELAYEAHLRQLQLQHPPAAEHRLSEQQADSHRLQQQQQQQQQHRSPAARGGKRRRRGSGCSGPGTAAAVTTSADTNNSAAALAAPVAAPAQRLAQISELTGEEPAEPPAQQQQAQQTQQAQQQPQQAQQHDWSEPATLLARALMEREESSVAAGAAGKAAAICRVDLSSAALLIGSALVPASPQAAVPGGGGGGGSLAAVEDATEAAAAGLGGSGTLPVAQATADEAAVEEATAGQEAQQGQQPRKRQRVFVHGNYHRYYGYRIYAGAGSSSAGGSSAGGSAGGEQGSGEQAQQSQQAAQQAAAAAVAADPRLAAFDRRWFRRRRCLDVGCNEGLVTLALAARFGARSMLGVDIDGTLVAKACRNLREARAAAAQRVRASWQAGVPPEERKAAQQAVAALAQTLFVHADFLDSEVEAGSLDTITCLSVTKWIHLNRGDAGLQALFAAFHRALAPGGLLLLEPQPWSSYRSAAGKVRRCDAPPGSYFHRLSELRLRPDRFADHLCTQLGFRLVKEFGVEQGAAAGGFARPMLLLRKTHRASAAEATAAAPTEADQAEPATAAAEERQQGASQLPAELEEAAAEAGLPAGGA